MCGAFPDGYSLPLMHPMRKIMNILVEAVEPFRGTAPRPPAEVLASYTDQDGYTVSIVGLPDDPSGHDRFGTTYISNGKTKVRAGYWMNYPERAWKIPERRWQRMSWAERAAMEVKQQATAYKPLKDQFVEFAQDDEEEDQPQVVARKWKTGQKLTPSEAVLLKSMTRSDLHPEIDQRTARD